jgi:cytochrome c oxidase subunit 2
MPWTRLLLACAGLAVAGCSTGGKENVIHVTARRFEYHPSEIVLKKSVPVVIELTSLDRKHGFKVPGLGIDEVVTPDKPTRIRIVPDKTGTFPFRCSVFCGSGHEDMTGMIVVRE